MPPVEGADKVLLPGLRLDLALAALEAGKLELAKTHAAEALRENTDRENWNYGNIIHDANQILGRCALREEKLAEAKKHLFAAGATPGSPQLDSFGPEMQLARELLDNGEKETVLRYLDLVARFWANPDEQTEANSKRLGRENLRQLEAWKKQIREGKVLEDPKWHAPGRFTARSQFMNGPRMEYEGHEFAWDPAIAGRRFV